MDIQKRLYMLLVMIFCVFIAGSSGYYVLYGGEKTLLDCIYMTAISLTSVGYGEVLPITGNPAAEIYTIVLITLGMGVILYALSTLTALLIEGELTDVIRKKKMEKKIQKLKNHYILCGGGETGRPLLCELEKNLEKVVLVESNITRIEACIAAVPNLLYIDGDATDDANLVKAGIEHARGIIISLPSDKDNLYITMTARMLNPKIRIISRMTDPRIKEKLIKAGADGVVSPNIIGALRMASEMIRPTAVDFLDQMLRSGAGTMRIHEIPILEKSGFAGKRLKGSGIRNRFNLLVLGLRGIDGSLEFNPGPDTMLSPGSTLVVMGAMEDIKRAQEY